MTTGNTTAPAASDAADNESGSSEQSSLALVILWSASQPYRVGDLALFPRLGETLIVGRSDDEPEGYARFVRQRPGQLSIATPLAGDAVSRRQLAVRANAVSLEVEQIGRCPTFFNGVERTNGLLLPGDTLLLKGELVLLCARRHAALPTLSCIRELQPFGEPDSAGMVGESPAIWRLRERLAFTALSNEHVLLYGESGSGKERAAAALHQWSHRARGRYVTRNAATIPPGIADAELFGNLLNYPNPGMKARPGLVGEACGGTFFLDEIGDLHEEVQPHVLRVLDGEYQPLGEASSLRADVRVIGATHRDPTALLRHDLYARFPICLQIPPLRERREDIPLLIRHLLLKHLREMPKLAERFLSVTEGGRLEPRVDSRLVDHIARLDLPRNVRELTALLWEALASSTGDTIRLPPSLRQSTPAPAVPTPTQAMSEQSSDALAAADIVACLERERGNVSRAATALGLPSRYALYRLMRTFGIKRDDAAE